MATSHLFPSLMSSQAQTIGQSLNLGREYTPETAAKMQALERRQQMVNALIAQGMQPKEVRQAGRFVVAPSMMEQLSGPLTVALGALGSGYLENERGEIQKEETARVAKAMQDYAAAQADIPTWTGRTVPGTGTPAVPGSPAVDEVPESYPAVVDAIAGPFPRPGPWSHESGAPEPKPFYVPGVKGQAAVPAQAAVPDRRETLEEALRREGFPPETIRAVLDGWRPSDASGDLKRVIEEAERPNQIGRQRTPDELRAADMGLMTSGVPGALDLVKLSMAHREAAATKPVTHVDLGGEVLFLRGEKVIRREPKTAAPGEIKTIDLGDNHAIMRDGMVLGHIQKGLSPADQVKAMNELIVTDPQGRQVVNQQLVGAKERIAAAGRPVTNIDNKLTDTTNEWIAKEFSKELSANRSKLRDTPALIESMEKSKKLISGAGPFVGNLANEKLFVAKFLRNNFGIDIKPDEVIKAEELNSRLMLPVLETLRKLDAQPTAAQQAILQRALGELSTDPGALAKVIGVYQSVLAKKIRLYNKDATSAMTGKRKLEFPYDPMIEIPEFSGEVDDQGEEIAKKRSDKDKTKALEYLQTN